MLAAERHLFLTMEGCQALLRHINIGHPGNGCELPPLGDRGHGQTLATEVTPFTLWQVVHQIFKPGQGVA